VRRAHGFVAAVKGEGVECIFGGELKAGGGGYIIKDEIHFLFRYIILYIVRISLPGCISDGGRDFLNILVYSQIIALKNPLPGLSARGASSYF
jgi:hypothetical protein